MLLVTGDIAINATGWPGHVLMVYQGGSNASGDCKVIHGTNSGDFHIVPQWRSGSTFVIRGDFWIFRPPWANLGAGAEARQTALQATAKAIATSSKYGLYRAVRLFAGDSTFGPKARERLQKYHLRRPAMMAGTSSKYVSTISCAEAVILSYQLTFAEAERPFFILKDAAHTMPRTLREYLQHAPGWTVEQRGEG